jgi:hypothetical protein
MLGVVMVAGLGAAATSAGAQATATESALKAAYLHKLAAFVEWPASAFASPESPINFCVVRDSRLGLALQRAAADQRIGAHPIAIRYLSAADKTTGCHVLYFGSLSGTSAAGDLKSVRGSPVLTVTDSESNNEAPGIVHFVTVGNRVRFEIDQNAAAENRLVLSSKLLSLAVAARPAGS